VWARPRDTQQPQQPAVRACLLHPPARCRWRCCPRRRCQRQHCRHPTVCLAAAGARGRGPCRPRAAPAAPPPARRREQAAAGPARAAARSARARRPPPLRRAPGTLAKQAASRAALLASTITARPAPGQQLRDWHVMATLARRTVSTLPPTCSLQLFLSDCQIMLPADMCLLQHLPSAPVAYLRGRHYKVLRLIAACSAVISKAALSVRAHACTFWPAHWRTCAHHA